MYVVISDPTHKTDGIAQHNTQEELSLTIVALELGNPGEFLKKAIQPPPPEGAS